MAELVVKTKNKKEEKAVRELLEQLNIEYVDNSKSILSPTFYFLVITPELKVHTYYHEVPQKHIKGIYYIHCHFARFSETRKHAFYTYQVYDQAKNIIPTNSLEIGEITCVLERTDYWGNRGGSTNYLIQGAKIYDSYGVGKNLAVENKKHTSKPISEFLKYIIKLQQHKTHNAIKVDNLIF